jgi:hypothetical protein
VGTGRLECVLRLPHQHFGQHADADHPVAFRAEDAGLDRLRPHPAGADAAKLGFDKLANVGVLCPGLQTMGGGAILAGLVLAAIGASVIDKEFINAAAFALAGAVLTFVGFMHGQAVGFAVSPTLAVAYLIVAGFLFALTRYPALAPALTAPDATLAATPAQ